jgi:hypothetical protein
MLDLLYVIASILFFVISILYIPGCDLLLQREVIAPRENLREQAD